MAKIVLQPRLPLLCVLTKAAHASPLGSGRRAFPGIPAVLAAFSALSQDCTPPAKHLSCTPPHLGPPAASQQWLPPPPPTPPPAASWRPMVSLGALRPLPRPAAGPAAHHLQPGCHHHHHRICTQIWLDALSEAKAGHLTVHLTCAPLHPCHVQATSSWCCWTARTRPSCSPWRLLLPAPR